MSNVAFDFEVLKKVAAGLPVPGGAASMPFAALGALGPDLFQYTPISNKLSTAISDAIAKALKTLTPAMVTAGTLPTVDLSAIKADSTLAAELFEKPLMAIYSALFGQIVTVFWPIFQTDNDVLNQLQTAANNKDGDALKALADQLNQLKADSDKFQMLAPTMMTVMAFVLEVIAVPPGVEATSANAKPWFPQFDRLFEFLRWHRTDVFAQNLANSAKNDNQKAYAYGYMCHVAASVTGKPFINNIAGGPYRTHWWRNRLVSNFVDAWTFGRYETPATMSGDTPNPPYASWANIGTSNLQHQFNVAGLAEPAGKLPPAIDAIATGNVGSLPSQFPADLAAYIQAAIDATYPPATRPPGFTTQAIQEAFVGLFGVVWFMTSGFGPMTPFSLGSAPTSCTSAPTWVTSGGTPPSPQSSGPSTGATVCGVVLAILAVLLFIFGAFTGGSTFGAGVGAVLGAIKAFTSGGGIDWDTLQCDVFWLRSLLLQAETGLVKSLVQGALAYPQPANLGVSGINGVTPQVDNSGVPLTKSNIGIHAPGVAVVPAYPLQLDATNLGFADLDFGSFPKSAVEQPPTMNFPLKPSYADSVVDGSGLQNGGIMAASPFPSLNKFFGDAVANAKQLLAVQAKGMPRYNLDADRGYGWHTWNPAVNTFPGNGTVNNPTPDV